jgi:hypothetical protein
MSYRIMNDLHTRSVCCYRGRVGTDLSVWVACQLKLWVLFTCALFLDEISIVITMEISSRNKAQVNKTHYFSWT